MKYYVISEVVIGLTSALRNVYRLPTWNAVKTLNMQQEVSIRTRADCKESSRVIFLPKDALSKPKTWWLFHAAEAVSRTWVIKLSLTFQSCRLLMSPCRLGWGPQSHGSWASSLIETKWWTARPRGSVVCDASPGPGITSPLSIRVRSSWRGNDILNSRVSQRHGGWGNRQN